MTDIIANFNWYSKLKEKYKKDATNKEYCKQFFESLSSMFNYSTERTEEEIKYLVNMMNHKLESWLRAFGKIGFAMDGNELYFGICSFVGGRLNKYGLMDEVTIFTLNGESKTFKVKDVVIMYNNASGTPEINALRYADKLTEIDTSWDCAVKNCRYTPLVLVKNEKTKRNIESAIEQSNEGKPFIVSGTDLLGTDLMRPSGDSKGVEILNITDVTNSDKLQYLTHAHDDLMRTFYQNYGIDTNSTGKMAQQSTEEIEGNVGRSFIIPNDNYNWRKRALIEIEEKFGIKIDIAWGESWGIELSHYKADIGNNGELTEEIPTEDETDDNDAKTGENNDDEKGVNDNVND